ncbi:hypothetical protein [Bacillus sp. V5-8f]|uniref:hypothetical protein n=1 Tax=Bacillus sp. V5-8f TaxID=2053044 RepID=UPI000C77CB39|nr:hypothetical protein [Bacillus sp. V5-8f]PLT32282.1 hypothetical protein CUU64_19455 [Bacillus sp. V5-8f]
MEKQEYYHDVLLNLTPGSEVNVHTGKKTFYNAILKKYHPDKKVGYFLIDQFYEFKSFILPIPLGKIVSLDLPVESQEAALENTDEATALKVLSTLPKGVSEDDE